MSVSIDDKLRFLRSPAAHRHGSGRVDVIDTHMSWLFLAGERVLKLKKPVRFPFLDFTTLQAREADCREELRLNRRLAPDVYLGVLPLVRGPDGLRLGGAGEVVDWLVEMRRLPQERMLDAMLQGGAVGEAELDRLADVLAGFYRRAERPAVSPAGHFRHLLSQQATSRDILGRAGFDVDRGRIGRALSRLDAALAEQRPAIEARARDGRLVDGHGDLRPEHVCLTDPLAIIDCLEFDRTLRTIDPFDEIAFLGLECAVLGAPWLGPALARRIEARLDDRVPPALFRLYTAFRATVRARLMLAHLLDVEVRERHSWEPRADRYMVLAETALAGGADTPSEAARR